MWIRGEEPRQGEEMGAVRSSFPYHSTAQPGVEPPLTRLPAHRAVSSCEHTHTRCPAQWFYLREPEEQQGEHECPLAIMALDSGDRYVVHGGLTSQ